jgi:uncharacterized protein Yka (UPF0111/DUF47 family)
MTQRAAHARRADAEAMERLAAEIRELAPALPARIEASPDDIETGVGQLVLTLVEFIRQVLEHQAIRRMEGGSLSEEETERLGLALMRLEERLDDIRVAFGIERDDLNIDLGPLGRLL